MGRGKIKKIKPVSLQARKAAIAQQQQLQAQKAALERQIAEERSKQARLQREIEEKERLVRGLERVGASAEEAYSYPPPWNTSYPQDYQQQQQLLQRQAQHSDSIAPISDKALSMLNHMLGNRGLMQRDPTTGTIDVVLSPETMASAATSSHLGNTAAGMTSYDPSSLLAGMQGIFAGDVDDEGMLEEGETNAETREALAEAMAAMKAAAHVAKALPLMMLKSAAQSMSHHGGNGQWTTTSSSSQYANHPHDVAEAHMVLDPQMMDEHLHEFRAMLEDPEERMRLGVGFEMLGWAVGDPNNAMPDTQRQGEGDGAGGWDGQGKTGDSRAAHGSDPVPTLDDMLKLPIFNNEAFRSSPLFGKPVSPVNAQAHQPQATPGDLYLESTDAQGSTLMDLHNLDMMQDFLSSASGMLNGPIFGGARGGSRDERSAPTAPVAGMGQAGEGWPPPPPQTQTQTHTRPRQPPAPRAVPTDVAEYPSGEMTASEAVRAVTELLEASSRKLQKVTGEHVPEGDDAVHGEDIDVRQEGRQQHGTRHVHSSAPNPTTTAGSSNVAQAAANAILRARASSSEAASDDTEHSDIDAISLDSDPNVFPEDEFPEDDEGGYYSDEDYEGEEYYENGERVAYTTDDDGEGSSRYTSSDGREGEYDSGDDDEVYESPERLAEFARRRQEAGIQHHPGQGTTNTSIPIVEQQRSSGTPTPTGHAMSTQQRNPISGQQMLEILKRMSPEARHNYQTALMREKMEYERLHQSGVAQSLPSPPPPQSQTRHQQPHLQKQQAQNTARPPSSTQQQKVPSVLDDPAVMATNNSNLCPLQDQAVNELFSWIKAVIWTIEQHAIRAARAQMEAKGVTVATSGTENGKDSGSGEFGKNKAAAATWTPKATPDGAKMRAMMRTVGIDVAPA
ncbi:hypothetical protein QFC22_005283 [Naganishia vaughanmartiniae]|uniref:Uncharacterized protein n=1 Tax=Naganishia vaughanmartiniae TaxID=1424756 RepID=A0ACC2WV61_9TREE|nr:hypothetical protein QFC22_005283 [Naganishia vaughanmartiniae]